MSGSEPQQNSEGGIWQAILKAAESLPIPLRFVIVAAVLVVGVVITGAIIPDNLLPLFYILFLGGGILYVWWEIQNSRNKREEDRATLARERQQQEHEQAMRRLELEDRRLSTPEPIGKPVDEAEVQRQAIPPEQLQQSYLQELLDRCDLVSMGSIYRKAATSQVAHLPLHRVFITLDVPAAQKGKRPEQWMEGEREQRERAVAAVSRERYLVLLGQPGSGKSTLVKFITACLCGEWLGKAKVNERLLVEHGWSLGRLLPVQVILRDYAARGLPAEQSLWQFIAAELERVGVGQYAPHLEKRLQTQGGLLLLDGLDEVPDAHNRREALRENILRFRREFGKVRIVVTSRPYAYGGDWQLPGFTRADLLDFSPEQVDGYIEQWYATSGAEDPELLSQVAEQYAEQLKGQIKANPNLAELAPRPLLLTLMVLLHRYQGGGYLPEERAALYDQSVDLLLDLWEQPKLRPGGVGQADYKEPDALGALGINRENLRNALSEVAFIAHRDQPKATRGTADIPGDQLAGILFAAPRTRKVTLEDIIAYVRDRAGLLEDRGPDPQREGSNVYGFVHRSFQEFLAACHLLNQPRTPMELVELVRGNPQRNVQGDPERWRETVLLAAGRVAGNIQNVVWLLLQGLCPRPLPADLTTVTEADWWGAFLAGRALWDVDRHRKRGFFATTEEMWQAVLSRLCDWHVALIEQGALPPEERAAAGEVLDRLGWLPPDLNHWVCCAGCADSGEDLLALRYPVTNAQFELFIKAGGYKDKAFWKAGEFGEWAEPRYWESEEFGKSRRAYPVVGVSWYEAAAYAAWLTSLLERARKGDGRLPAEERALIANLLAANVTEVRLPSDEEWVRLAGGEKGERYPWDAVSSRATKEQSKILERANTIELGWRKTTPVYLYPLGESKPFGLMDLAGNVWEWVGDGRAVRGGSWNYFQRDARVSARDDFIYPHDRYNDFGFRLVAPVLSEF